MQTPVCYVRVLFLYRPQLWQRPSKDDPTVGALHARRPKFVSARETGAIYDDDMSENNQTATETPPPSRQQTEPDVEQCRATLGEYRCPQGRSYRYPEVSRRLPSLDFYDDARGGEA